MRNLRTLAVGITVIAIIVSSGCGVSKWLSGNKKENAAPKKEEKAEQANKAAILKAEKELRKEENYGKALDNMRLKMEIKRLNAKNPGMQINVDAGANKAQGVKFASLHNQVPGALNALTGHTPPGKKSVAVSHLDQSTELVELCTTLREGTNLTQGSKAFKDSRPGTLVARDKVKRRCYNLCSSDFQRVSCKVISGGYMQVREKADSLPANLKLGGEFVKGTQIELFEIPKMMIYGSYVYRSSGSPGHHRAAGRSGSSSGRSKTYATKAWVRKRFASKAELDREIKARKEGDKTLKSVMDSEIDKLRRIVQPPNEGGNS